MYSRRDEKKIRKTFPTMSAATAWRQDAGGAVRRNEMRAPVPVTVAEAAAAWLEGARSGVILNRSKEPYKPSAIRAYEASLRLRVLPEFGRAKLSAVTQEDLQDFVEALRASGASPSVVMTTILPLRAIYRRAKRQIPVNPTHGLELPAMGEGRDRIASPDECIRLLAALPEKDRPIWATAMYAGLRRGELMALRIEDIDLATGKIEVRRNWDAKEGEVKPKSKKGIRRVPVASVLRDYLDQHLVGLEWNAGLVFGSSAVSPFAPSGIRLRANRTWKGAGLELISLHECRHTFASLMIAAGVNAKALSTYMGHANISITYDLYGHLMPGNEDEAAGLMDAYPARASAGSVRASLAPVTS